MPSLSRQQCLPLETLLQWLVYLRAILVWLLGANLKLKCKKCELFCKTIKYLINQFSRDGIWSSERKVDYLYDWKAPATVTLCGPSSLHGVLPSVPWRTQQNCITFNQANWKGCVICVDYGMPAGFWHSEDFLNEEARYGLQFEHRCQPICCLSDVEIVEWEWGTDPYTFASKTLWKIHHSTTPWFVLLILHCNHTYRLADRKPALFPHRTESSDFDSHLLKEVCHLWKVDKTWMSPFVPWSNRMVEQSYRLVKQILWQMCCNDLKVWWDIKLPFIGMALNST